MCLICVELIRQKMSILEAERNLREAVLSDKEPVDKILHYAKLKDAIENMSLDEIGKILDEEGLP